MNAVKLTPEQIRSILTSNKDNYDGDPNSQEENYRGRTGTKIREILDFKFRIVNSTSPSVDKVIAINSAFYSTKGITATTTAAGSPLAYTTAATIHEHYLTEITNGGHSDVDGVLDDATVITGIVCSSLSTKKIRDFRAFCKQNPTVITQIDITADDKAQWNQNLTVRQVSPFRTTGDKYLIRMDDFYNPNIYDNKKIQMDLLKRGYVIQFDDQTLVLIGVGAGRTIDVTMKVGIIENKSATFYGNVETALFQ